MALHEKTGLVASSEQHSASSCLKSEKKVSTPSQVPLCFFVLFSSANQSSLHLPGLWCDEVTRLKCDVVIIIIIIIILPHLVIQIAAP